MTIDERHLFNNVTASDTETVTLELSLKYWFSVKKSNYSTTITDFTSEGANVTTQLRLKLGQRVQLDITSEHHSLKRLPAEILRAEYDQVNNRYWLRFCVTEISEVAYKNTEFVLQQIEASFGQNFYNHDLTQHSAS